MHDIINQYEYKETYFKSLIPLGLKYAEVTANILAKIIRIIGRSIFSLETVNHSTA